MSSRTQRGSPPIRSEPPGPCPRGDRSDGEEAFLREVVRDGAKRVGKAEDDVDDEDDACLLARAPRRDRPRARSRTAPRHLDVASTRHGAADSRESPSPALRRGDRSEVGVKAESEERDGEVGMADAALRSSRGLGLPNARGARCSLFRFRELASEAPWTSGKARQSPSSGPGPTPARRAHLVLDERITGAVGCGLAGGSARRGAARPRPPARRRGDAAARGHRGARLARGRRESSSARCPRGDESSRLQPAASSRVGRLPCG